MNENWAFTEIQNKNCRGCDLYQTAPTVCRVGQGPKDAKIMMIGEAPGDDPVKPFSGPAGQRLDLELSRVGLKREDIYITNVVKCRPPDKRTPEKGEIEACRQFLTAELGTVQPSYLLLLGNPALWTITKKSGITKHRGQVQTDGKTTVMATFHPSAIRRNPKLTPYFAEDFIRFSQIVNGRDKPPELNITIVRDLEQLRDLIRSVKETSAFAYDLETEGLYEWVPFSRLWCIGIATAPDRAWVIPLEHPDHEWSDFAKDQIHKTLVFLFETLDRKRAAHNGEFDNRWLRSRGIRTEHSFDTMIAAHLLDENLTKGLKPLARQYLGAGHYEKQVDVTLHPPPLEPLCHYCGEDVCYTYALRPILGEQLLEDRRVFRLFKTLLMPATQVFSRIESTGIYLDQKRLKERTAIAKERRDEYARRTITYVPKMEGLEEPNLNSTAFLRKLLYTTLKLPILEKTPTGLASTAEPVIKRLKHEHPIVELLLSYREYEKRLNTFLEPWAEYIQWDERLHANYNIVGTVTGRPSSSDPNLQQTERGEFIRGIVSAPEGFSIISCDLKHAEMRIAAMESGDPTLLEIFCTDRDPHAATAMKLLGKINITKAERKKGKIINFALLYGMGWRGLQRYALDKYDLILSDEEAQQFHRAFFDMYPTLRDWHKRKKEEVRKHHQVRSLIGRIRHLPDILSCDKDVVAEAERQAINSTVQGLASDMNLLGAILLAQDMDWVNIKIVGSIHDCLLFECKNDIIKMWTTKIKETMENLPLDKMFGFYPTVPIKVDVKVSKYWEGEE